MACIKALSWCEGSEGNQDDIQTVYSQCSRYMPATRFKSETVFCEAE